MKKQLNIIIILLIILITIGFFLIFKIYDLQEQINNIELNLRAYYQSM